MTTVSSHLGGCTDLGFSSEVGAFERFQAEGFYKQTGGGGEEGEAKCRHKALEQSR